MVSPSPPCCPLYPPPSPATNPTSLTHRREGLASIASTMVAMSRGRAGSQQWQGGFYTRPGAAPSPPLLCLRLGERAVTAAAAAAAAAAAVIAVAFLLSRGIIKLPLFGATGPRSAAARRWRDDDAAPSGAVIVVVVIPRDLQVVARRCDGYSFRRRPSFSCDGNGDGGGDGGGGGQEGPI